MSYNYYVEKIKKALYPRTYEEDKRLKQEFVEYCREQDIEGIIFY